MNRHVTCLGLVIVGLLTAASVFAGPCLTARPGPACRSCIIAEFGYGYELTPPLKIRSIGMVGDSVTFDFESQTMDRHLLTSELGYIYNLNAKYGLGFTHFTGWNVGENLRGGLKLRVRKWLTPKTSLDISGGAILWGMNRSQLKDPALIGGASVTFSEWESVNLLVEVVETQPHDYTFDYGDGILRRNISPRQRNVGVYLGYKLSSKPGLFFNAGAVATAVILTAVFLATVAGSN